jgi:hypothetical protein
MLSAPGEVRMLVVGRAPEYGGRAFRKVFELAIEIENLLNGGGFVPGTIVDLD